MSSKANDPYLEVTYRKGRALAAYLHLPGQSRARSVRTERASPVLLVDYTADGEPIGIEITAPGHVTAAEVNDVLAKLGHRALSPEELGPLLAA